MSHSFSLPLSLSLSLLCPLFVSSSLSLFLSISATPTHTLILTHNEVPLQVLNKSLSFSGSVFVTFNVLYIFPLKVYYFFFSLHVSYLLAVPTEARRGQQIPCTWLTGVCELHWETMWVFCKGSQWPNVMVNTFDPSIAAEAGESL